MMTRLGKAIAHEAAHAVFNTIFDIPLKFTMIDETHVSLKRDITSWSLGFTSNVPHKETMASMTPAERKRYRELWQVSTAAGIAIEIILFGKADQACDPDFDQLKVQAPDWDPDVIVEVAKTLFQIPEVKLAFNLVRNKLSTKRHLTGDELKGLVGKRVTPLQKLEIQELALSYIKRLYHEKVENYSIEETSFIR